MQFDAKYKIEEFPLELEVVEAFDFKEEPILLLEKDQIGNFYLSYLLKITEDSETRVYLQISLERLNIIKEGELTIANAFTNAENKFIYALELSLSNGLVSNAYLLPSHATVTFNLIPQDYKVAFKYMPYEPELDLQELLSYSERKNKLTLDILLQSKNLITNVKPYAIYKVLLPMIQIIKHLLEFDNRNADKYLAFSQLRHGSFGVTIEINYSKDLFLEKESYALETIIQLLEARTKEDFQNVISTTRNDKYIKEYLQIVTSLIYNDAKLHAAYANPIKKQVLTTTMDKENAEKTVKVLDEAFDIIEDIEEIIGVYLEIDIDNKEPSFKIYHNEEGITVRGKFDLSILEKIKNDYVNIGKEVYLFTIKTLYYPETLSRPEEIKRFMLDYKKVGQ